MGRGYSMECNRLPKLIESKITKSNKLIEAGFNLTLLEQRLVLKLATTITRDDDDFKDYPFNIIELIQEFGMDKTSGYRDLITALKGLQSKVLTIREADGPLYANFISSTKEKSAAGTLTLCFDPKLKPYLLKLTDKFTIYKVKDILGLRSRYSHRLYELLKQHMWKIEKYRQSLVPLEDLRFYLGVPETKLYADIKRHIVFSQKELKEKSDISFTFEEIKKGRKVESILFKMKNNEISSHSFDSFNSIEDSSTDMASLQNQIWLWTKKWEESTGKQMNIFDRVPSENNKTIKYLNSVICRLSEATVRKLWNEELLKSNPNPINFLVDRLPKELHKII